MFDNSFSSILRFSSSESFDFKGLYGEFSSVNIQVDKDGDVIMGDRSEQEENKPEDVMMGERADLEANDSIPSVTEILSLLDSPSHTVREALCPNSSPNPNHVQTRKPTLTVAIPSAIGSDLGPGLSLKRS
jgi:hypothetical protein